MVSGMIFLPALLPRLLFALQVDIDCNQKVVVYDQSSQDVTSLSSDCFLTVLLGKLEKSFTSVHLLAGKTDSAERTWTPAESCEQVGFPSAVSSDTVTK